MLCVEFQIGSFEMAKKKSVLVQRVNELEDAVTRMFTGEPPAAAPKKRKKRKAKKAAKKASKPAKKAKKSRKGGKKAAKKTKRKAKKARR